MFLNRRLLAEPYEGFRQKTTSLPINDFVVSFSHIPLSGYSGDENILVARIVDHNAGPFRNTMKISMRESNKDYIAESIGCHKLNLFRDTLP